jgi:hypothetical protein
MSPIVESISSWFKSLDEALLKLKSAPPGLPKARAGEQLTEWMMRHESHHREGVEEVALHWLDNGDFQADLPDGVRFWTRVRFTHAFWLSKMMAAPQDNFIQHFPSDEKGRISIDAQYWLFFESWEFAGCDAWLNSMSFFCKDFAFDSGAE